MQSDNIVAISTGLVASGVAVIRISGEGALNVAEKMFSPSGRTAVKDFEPNKMYVGEIKCEGFADYGMCVFFKAPKSFTGENVVEFHCHGGTAIAKGVLNKAKSLGCRLADRGEFTRRAFLNGKLSLSSCEGLIDMINSEYVSGVKAGYYLYREKLTSKVSEMQNKLKDALSEIAADVDYPEEDLDVSSRETAKKTLTEVIFETEELLKSFKVGRVLKNGVKVGIVGKPNTGKSSILNALLNYEKAIVSEVAGTTRDIVEGSISVEGVEFNFYDTAGIRESADSVEQKGIYLSKRVLEDSDILLFVLDGGDIAREDDDIFDLIKDKNVITVVNKIDKGDYKDGRADIYVSAKNKTNIDKLRTLLLEKAGLYNIDVNGDFLCEERHYEALKNAKNSLTEGLNNVDSAPLDLVEIDIKNGWSYLGEISGETSSEEIIDNIFSKFCVGK